jgi:probable addiction module antidote protein
MVLGAFSEETVESLKSEEDRAAYLDACLKEDDPILIVHALGVIARAKGMAQLARETGLSRTSLYRTLSAEGNPEFATVLKVIKALGHDLES